MVILVEAELLSEEVEADILMILRSRLRWQHWGKVNPERHFNHELKESISVH